MPIKVVCSPYTIEFSKTGELFGLTYRGDRLGRCTKLGLNNTSESMGTRLSVTALLYEKSDWVLLRTPAGDPNGIAYGYADNLLPRVEEASVTVEPHPDLADAELLSFDILGPFEIRVTNDSAPGTPPPYDYGEYLDLFPGEEFATATDPAPPAVRCYYPGIPTEEAEPKCECGAEATGSLRHSDYCPRSKS